MCARAGDKWAELRQSNESPSRKKAWRRVLRATSTPGLAAGGLYLYKHLDTFRNAGSTEMLHSVQVVGMKTA